MALFAVVMLLFLFSILCFQLFFIGLSSTLLLFVNHLTGGDTGGKNCEYGNIIRIIR